MTPPFQEIQDNCLTVIPANAGIQRLSSIKAKALDPGVRRDDGEVVSTSSTQIAQRGRLL